MTTTHQTSLDRFFAARAAVPCPPQSAGERRALVDCLEDPDRWPVAAASLLAELGYRLIEPEAGAGDDSHLLVALRAEPTLRHFDPESIAYYAPSGRIAALVTLTRATSLGRHPPERQALWGHVHVTDRIPVENRFMTFGGDLRVAVVNPDLTVVDLWSPAPLVRWGGHSQATDELAEAIGAFFGRLIVPVDFVAGAAERLDATLPEVLYRAFLIDALARHAGAVRRGAPRTRLDAWIAAAWNRARTDGPMCHAAETLLVELGLRDGPTA
jgi:hypothetical protein